MSRLTRSQYIPIALCWAVLMTVCSMVVETTADEGVFMLTQTVNLLAFVGFLYVAHARIKDAGGKAWWVFLFFIPLINLMMWFTLMFLSTKEVDNV